MHRLKFTLNENGFGTVTLDGQPIDIVSLAFAQRVGELNQVTLTIFASVDGEVEVQELATTHKGKLNATPTPTEKPKDVAPPRRPKFL